MVDKKIENRIQTAIRNVTPDVLDKIYASCDEQKGTVINMSSTNINRKRNRIGSLIAAAALLMLFIGGFAFNQWKINNSVYSKVILDVNPSININVNAKEKVLSVDPLNEDGRKIIGDMDLKNTNLDVAINALIGSMLRNGYLSELHNAILVSVENNNAKKGAELQSKLMNEIERMLKNNQFEPVVFAQTVAENPGIKELAKKYNISEGKAALINELIQQDNKLTFEELAPLSVHELALIIESKGFETKEVAKTGQASQKAYIGKEKAREIAFAHARVNSSQVTSEEIEFDVEDGIMVYEIEFNVGITEYEYDINAVTGEIIHYSKEADDDVNYNGKNTGNASNANNTSNHTSESASYIGKDKAKAAAFAHANVTEDQVTNLEIDFDYDDKKAVYEIEFETNDAEYEYVIDAITGKVLESERDAKKSSGSNNQRSSKHTSSKDYIGKDEALNIALKHAGVSKSAVTEYEVELDKDDGKVVYEIEFKTGDAEYDYEIDAYTGKVLKHEEETRDVKYTSKNSATPVPTKAANSYISKSKVKEIVFKHAKVDEGKVKDLDIELDNDDGKAVYEVDFKVGTTEYDYEVDAITGLILKAESDTE